MQESQNGPNYKHWISTYGLLTAQRVLDRFKLELPHDKLVSALHSADHGYYLVLKIPMMNIFNGIIFQQAYDYQVYAQKLMIDYRLSEEYSKDPEMPGANIRADLNDQYEQMLITGKAFNEAQYQHYRMISESQAYLIQKVSGLHDPAQDLVNLKDDLDFKEKTTEFIFTAEAMTNTFRAYRSQFYNMILIITERLSSLSDYHLNQQTSAQERESLAFDRGIGG